jgi:hypothetical protein
MYATMEGLIKSGVQHYTHHLALKVTFHKFVYEFSLSNYNNNQPFLKKLYHLSLTVTEKQEVKEILLNNLLDQIEWAIQQVESDHDLRTTKSFTCSKIPSIPDSSQS